MLELKKCSICGKEFIPAALHMYKTKNSHGITKLQCSYTCYRKAGEDNGRHNRDAKTGNSEEK